MGHPVYVSTLTKKVGGGQKNPKNPTFSKKAKKKFLKSQNLSKFAKKPNFPNKIH
jgi:hypothetical protein